MTFHIITAFPESLKSYLEQSMIKRALSRKIINVKIYDLRKFTKDKHNKIDARPYGGGPGMVLAAEPVLRAVSAVKLKIKNKIPKTKTKNKKKDNAKIIILSARGKLFDSKTAKKFAKNYKDIIMIAGHYEGIDRRVKKITKAEEVSVGPYILTGGELPALVVLDATSRQLKGFLGKEESLEEKRVASNEVYTRPEVFKYKNKKYRVPEVLLTGHHKNIEKWRKNKEK